MMAKMSVLVTGSSGFIGFQVARALADTGHKVVGLDPLPPMRALPGVTTVQERLGDVARISALLRSQNFESVVHAGGISGPMLLRDDPYAICQANVVGLINLIEAARQTGVRRVVYCSSAAAFGHTPPAPVPDDAPLRPINLYGATKATGDLILGAYRDGYGLDCIAMRFTSVYGPGRRTECAVRTMLSNALAGRPSRFEWGIGLKRQYLFVDDAVHAVLCAIKAGPTDRFAYNIAGPDFVEMTRIAEIIRGLVPGAEIEFSPERDGLGYRRNRLDISAARDELGFTPVYGINEGVAAYLTWLRSSGKLIST